MPLSFEKMNKLMEEFEQDILIESPLEPEKGGYRKAFLDNYSAHPDVSLFALFARINHEFPPTYCPPHICQGSLKNRMLFTPVLRLESGEIENCVNYKDSMHRYADTLTGDLFSKENRTLSVETCARMGFDLKEYNNFYKENVNNPYDFDCCNEFLHIGFTELKEIAPDFTALWDKAARVNAPKLSFDDAKYEQQFNKLENIMLHMNYCIHEGLPFNPYLQEGPTAERHACIDIPTPTFFKSENAYLKSIATIAASAIVKQLARENVPLRQPNYDHLLDGIRMSRGDLTRELNFQKTNSDFVADVAGLMIAAQCGVSVNKGDLARLRSYFPNVSIRGLFVLGDLGDLKNDFALAARIANHVKDLSKEVSTNQRASLTEIGLWNNWKQSHQEFAIRMATPSLELLCQKYKVEPSKENVMKALDSFVKEKQHSLESNKEHHRAAFKSDEPLGKGDIGKIHERAAKEPVKGTREAAKTMER